MDLMKIEGSEIKRIRKIPGYMTTLGILLTCLIGRYILKIQLDAFGLYQLKVSLTDNYILACQIVYCK
jgi:hypothetical protein